VGAGYFAAAPGDAPIRITKEGSENGSGWKMWLNPNFAHMPEPALRAIAAIEFARYCANNEPSFAFYHQPLEALTTGLMAAAGTLDYDMDDQDEMWWKKIVAAYQLPNLSLSDMVSYGARHDNEIPVGSKIDVTEYLSDLKKKSLAQYNALTALGLATFHPESPNT